MADTSKQLSLSEEQRTSDYSLLDEGRLYQWYHGVFFQATIVGTYAFAAPGLWNATQAGNAILFALMIYISLSGSILINRIGIRYTLALGAKGYALYPAALYQNNRYGIQWLAAEGAIMLSYPPPENRGNYLAYWLAYRNSGAILGAAIKLAFNYSGKSLAKKGIKFKFHPQIPAKVELKETSKLMLRKEFILLLIRLVFHTSFTPHGRSRTLAPTGLMRTSLDWKRLTLNQRARYSFLGMTILSIGFLAKSPEEIVGYSSVARGVEAEGQCVSSAGLILAWWGIELPLGFFIVRRVGIERVGAEGYIPKAKPSDTGAGSADNNALKA
ncbi:hypothetical protein BKA66DRAFT_438646 [Pyrenochaeta sp. MPI-SDFR-AT-0127]|nr:hypothetical protein BKA66DRAFT_438646 [Pyrenochaeta sp. MPI-SDFR-AT-0127]